MAKEFKKGKMVPVPSHSIVPERDVNKLPVLECQHLGIDFGGLTAVNEFNLTIGRTDVYKRQALRQEDRCLRPD